MGGEGSMMAANNSLKNNRSLLSKRKEKNSLSGSYSHVELADFPKATPQGLRRLREKMQQENKQRGIKLILGCGFFCIVLFSVFLYLI